MEKSSSLSNVQQWILGVFEPIHAYLERTGMEYYMLGGTLLGAVRHKGFIPWDDDIDIGIPRGQYEKFLREIKKELPEYMRVETYWNSESHHYYFSRIVDMRHSMKRLGSLEDRSENVWVDIFPLDGMPNNGLVRRYHMFRLLVFRALYHISCFEKVNLKRPNRPLSERIVIKFVELTGFGRKLDTRKKLNQIDALLKRYPVEKSRWIVNFMGQYKFREMFPKSMYGKGRLYPFENYMLMGPEDYDGVLTQMYGDYMTPPKDADKNAHAAEIEK